MHAAHVTWLVTTTRSRTCAPRFCALQIPRSEELGLGPEKVRREIQLQARLSHVNIVELKQVGGCEGQSEGSGG